MSEEDGKNALSVQIRKEFDYYSLNVKRLFNAFYSSLEEKAKEAGLVEKKSGKKAGRKGERS